MEIDSPAQVNPYAPSAIDARMGYEPVWTFQSLHGEPISFEADLSRDEIINCVMSKPYSSSFHKAMCFGFALMLMFYVYFTLAVFPTLGGQMVAVVKHPLMSLMSFFVVLLLAQFLWNLPKCSNGWHVRDWEQTMSWLSGNVVGRMDKTELHLVTSVTTVDLSWDSLTQVYFSDSYIWLSYGFPFPMMIPLHSRWFEPNVWRSIVDALRDHPRVPRPLRLHSTAAYDAKVRFETCAPPNIEQTPEGSIPFRADGSDQFASGFTKLEKYHGTAFRVAMISVYSITMYYEASFSVLLSREAILSGVMCALIVVPSLTQWIWNRRPYGSGWLGRKHELWFNQAGYIVSDHALIASPAATFRIAFGPHARLEVNERDVLVRLSNKPAWTFVIPSNQFIEADFERVQELATHSSSSLAAVR